MFSIKDLDVSLADIKSTSIVYMAVKDLLFYPSGKPPRLPVAYQEVEYIQSSGTQYINTGISANQYLSFEIDFQAVGTAHNSTFLGARNSSARFGLMIYNGKFHMMIGQSTSSLAWDVNVDTNRHKGSVFSLGNGNFTETFDSNTSDTSSGTSAYVNTNFLLFKYDYSTSSETYAACPMKLYSFKLYTGGLNLVRDFVPCYRKEDNVIGLYDLVNNEFYTNSGSGSFTRGNNVEYSLPKEYSEVYYIKSTATNPGTENSSGQYINTDYIPNKDTKITIDMNFDNLTVQSRLFAIHESNSSYMTIAAYINGSSKWARAMKNGEGDWVSTEVAVDTSRHTFTLKNGNYKINTGNTVNYNASNGSTASTSARSPLPLLAAIEPGNSNRIVDHSSAKIYGCTIFESEVMVRNLIPCIRKRDKKPGLYDFVTKRFFVNAGTGEFTYGAEKLYTQTQNTVAYYPLENDTNDYSGNKKNLTNNGATFVNEDGIRVGYNDNNTSKYARGSFALTSGNNPFTISLFAKNKSKTNYGLMVGTGYGSGTQGANVFFKDNQLYFGGWSNDTASGFVSTGKWLHIVFTFDGTTGKLYVDGELKVSKNVTYSVPTSSIYTTLFANYIGNISSPTDAFYGYLSQVLVENRAWTVEDINKYRKGIANRYIDKRENYQEVEYIGRNGNNYIDTEWIPDLTLGYKVEVGYKISTSGSRYIIMSSYDGTDNNNGFEINSGSVSNNSLRYLIKGTTFEMFSSNSMNVGSFNDIVFESSGNTKKATLNGTDTSGSYSASGKFGNSMLLFIDRDLRWTTFSKDSFLSYCRIYDGETLVRDFIPCYRRSDGTIGLWDKVSKKFFNNEGTGTFSKGADIIRRGDVTFCEYIQSSGTQYINTGIFASNNIQVETKVLVPDYSTLGPFFGSGLAGWANAGGNYYHCTPHQSKFYCGINNSEVNGGTTAANQEYEIVFNNESEYLNVNGTNIVSVDGTVGYTGTTIMVNGRGGVDGTQYGRFGYNRFYYFKIYDKTTGTYLRNFKPCYITATGEGGLWDEVEQKFYKNAGTGSFIVGGGNTREPLESTIAYYPFLNDVGEVTGKSSGTNTGVTITTLNGVKCGYFNGSSRIETNISSFTNINHTLACWAKRNGGNSSGLICSNPCGVFNGDVIYPNSDGDKYVYQSYHTTSGSGFSIKSNALNQSEWHCIIFTGGKLYVDGVLQGSDSGGYVGGQVYTIGGHTTNSSCTRSFFTGYMGDVVIDNSAWNDVQVSAYYNKTRSRYVS